MKFDTKYERKPDAGEDISPDSKTETSGYIPAQVQIERLIQSGENLRNYRKEQYDFASDAPDDDSVYVPTRLPSVDMADVSQLALQVEQRLQDEAAAAVDFMNAHLVNPQTEILNSTASPSKEVQP